MTNDNAPTTQALALAAELRFHTDASRKAPPGARWQINIAPDLADTLANTLDALVSENAKLREAFSNAIWENNKEWTSRMTRDAIAVEKVLCAAMNRSWQPSGMSTMTLINDLIRERDEARALLDSQEKAE